MKNLPFELIHMVADVFFMKDDIKSLVKMAMVSRSMTTIIHSTEAYQTFEVLDKEVCFSCSFNVLGRIGRLLCEHHSLGNDTTIKYLKYYCRLRKICIPRLFSVVCDKGRLEVAKWLHETFRLTSEDIRGRYNSEALRWAHRKHHTGVTDWLQETFSLKSSEEIRKGISKKDDSFMWVQNLGHALIKNVNISFN